jgi:tetratricopeptide (TPR) repeat protein
VANETLEFAEQVFGPDHPNVAESLNNLALICYSQGKEAEAAIFEQTLTQRQGKELWPDHSDRAQYLNKLVLLNLAKRKYSEAESFFERALAIKKYALGQDHSELSQILGNLADLHKSQGNYLEAETFLKSLRVRGDIRLQTDPVADLDTNSKDLKEIRHNREYMRCTGHFPAKLSMTEKTFSIDNDQVSVSISLPSVFSEQYSAVEMEGPGVITRIDEENEGVGIQFIKSFKQFTRADETEVAGKIRYKRLAHYLTALEELPRPQFLEAYPRGFFVERARMDFDNDVIFRFSTNEIDVLENSNQFPIDLVISDFLEARVIEVNKKKIDSNEGVITIGRSASNDIVLYNQTISKSHAFLYFPTSNNSRAYLADLQSTNSTFLNDEKITPYVAYDLADGDEISFGPQTKVIYLSSFTFYDFISSLKRSSECKMHS